MAIAAATNASFFDTLPTDIFPRFFAWLDDDNTLEFILLHGMCSLRDASRSIFTTLRLTSGDKISFDVREKTITIGTNIRDFLIKKVINFFGPSIETLSFHRHSLSNWYSAHIIKFCTGKITSINWFLPDSDEEEDACCDELTCTCEDDYEEWLGNFCTLLDKLGKQVLSLKVDAGLAFTCCPLPEDCEELLMDAIKKCVNLKSLDVGINLSLADKDLWKCIGSNVESISVNDAHRCCSEYNRMLRWIRLYCPRLTSLHAFSTYENSDLFKFILSYGAQLIRAPIDLLSTEELEKVAESCPNILLSHRTSGFGESISAQDKAISPFVDVLVLTSTTDFTVVSNYLAVCKRLESLIVTGAYDTIGTFRFHHQMMELKRMTLLGVIKSSELRNICTSTPNLEILQVGFTDGISDGTMFDWMSAKIPHIQCLLLEECDEVKWHSTLAFLQKRRHLFRDLTRSISRCQRLESLVLHIGTPLTALNELETIVLPLRLRGIHCSLESTFFGDWLC